MKSGIRAVLVVLLALLLISGAVLSQEGGEGVDSRYVGSIPAPEFPSGLDWLNVPQPLTIDGLRGKIIILDFWTYGCINCIHMIPVLERLEEKYAQEIVVIGVHSAKFENEGQTENLRQIVQRYDLRHPVINDNQFIVWRRYGANAWPSFVVIDPRGNVVAVQAGEIPFEAFDQYIGAMVQYYDQLGQGDIDRTPLEVALEGAGNPGTPLLFPGKVTTDPIGRRLFIADSNHHRIVVADLQTYEVLDVIGTGRRGFADGGYDVAQFNKPQGMAVNGDTLYVADTNNHAIRKVDLATKQVTTIAGTGQQGRSGVAPGSIFPNPRAVDLRSPWDVALGDGDNLHIAMAGTHQLWALNLRDDTLYPTVGNGRESLINRRLADSELAQPSGLYYQDGLLYFADSESSSVRVADFNNDTVRTLAGPEIGVGDATERNILFLFDDIDGPLGVSRLQHPLDVVGASDGKLYVADTYNSKIKAIDTTTNTISTVFGQGGDGGYRDGAADVAAFDEPGGLDYADGKLYVADTNNHVIRVIDLATNTVSTVQFPNVERLLLASNTVHVVGGNSAQDEVIDLGELSLIRGDSALVLVVELPQGYKINTLIESKLALGDDSIVQLADGQSEAVIRATNETIPVRLSDASGGPLRAELTLFYCLEGDEGLCFIDEVTYIAQITVTAGGAETIQLRRTIVPPALD